MPFYIRKSISAGPFRFNLSSSGVGVSVGVKGLRIGTGPRGHYVHAGRGGLYYRASLGGTRNSPTLRHASPTPLRPRDYGEEGRVTMIEVQSGDVGCMRDSTVADLVDDLNEKQTQIRLGITAAICLALIGGVVLSQSNSGGQSASAVIGSIVLVAALPAWALGEWFDSYKRTTVLFYKLQGSAEAAYRKVTESFDALAACHGKWHIASGGAVQDLTTWKRNAGAAHLVNRKTARFAYILPKVLRSNVTPPTITLGSRTFYFLPEVMLVKHGGRFGAVGYDDLQIRDHASHFIEDGARPVDAQVVGSTWKHPNKSGGPDRRFRDNRQLPICLYDMMHLSSSSGVNELIEFSRTGFVRQFSTALHDLPRRQAPESVGDMLRLSAVTPDTVDAVVSEPPVVRRRLSLKLLAGAAVLAGGIAVVAVYTLHDSTSPMSTEVRGSVGETVSAPTLNAAKSRALLGQAAVPGPINAPVQPSTPSQPMVTVKTPANIRSAPSISAAVVRVAGAGEKFDIFGKENGWVKVGIDQPIGWIAASLLTQ